MARISFLQPDGTTSIFTANEQDTVLDVALDNNVPGIIGQCGGGCTCCSCHCWVTDKRLAPPHQDECDLLEFAYDRKSSSRLACQIPALDGLRVEVPERQSIGDQEE